MTIELFCGDNLDILPTIPSQSVDAAIMDPPYPHIKRDYGTWTTEEWWALMVDGVIPEVRRILKPTGSAVFILQPNSEHVGQMRGWLWEFMAWVCREWNMVQDVWWWNITPFPTVFCRREYGLMKQALKSCVWCGPPTCYRDQSRVLLAMSDRTKEIKLADRVLRRGRGSDRMTVRKGRLRETAEDRNGATPQNVLPIANTASSGKSGSRTHSAGTPLKLADWWVRYICPPGGTVVDPFVGSGTMVLAALQNGCNGIGIDNVPKYIDIAQSRIDEAQAEMIQGRLAV